MTHGKHTRKRIRVLVKAFPQHSHKYEETVCCAGVDVDAGQFLRLYPIRYRRLDPAHRFNRYDLIEITATKAADPRPESYHVDEDSIRIVEAGKRLGNQARVKLWKPFIAPSMTALAEDNRHTGRSLGIVRPDPGSVRFSYKPAEQSDAEDQAVARIVHQQQQSFLEDPLKPLAPPPYSFYYAYTSDGHSHRHQIHDWEVQATFIHYKQRYGSEAEALKMMTREYQDNIPRHNLHFIMGNMQKRQHVFILIGLLRNPVSPEGINRQGELF